MPRNISFFYTTDQIRDRSKTVTRRRGWKFLQRGDILNACVKCQGLKRGEKIERICQIRVTGVRREMLAFMASNPRYGKAESVKEGFPDLSGWQFVKMFCRHMNCDPYQKVTRIEFEYV
jgi:hypothetical protein